ncbi:MAG: hypothetical protein HWE16_06905 [Gammaproteobacteria bacterium]|nr:hypothetical protein [Gammaproteobacteria bacterium]
MKRYLALALGVMAVLSTPVHAVDGYKDLKFGMSLKEVKESGYCDFIQEDSGQKGVDFLGCANLKFSGDEVPAVAFFINDKLLRFGLEPSIDEVMGLMNALANKYGGVSSQSDEQEFNAVDQYPNREAYIAFDNDTVVLKIASDEYGNQGALLMYTSPEYDIQLLKNQEKAFSDDL